jgi:hypothetical protein
LVLHCKPPANSVAGRHARNGLRPKQRGRHTAYTVSRGHHAHSDDGERRVEHLEFPPPVFGSHGSRWPPAPSTCRAPFAASRLRDGRAWFLCRLIAGPQPSRMSWAGTLRATCRCSTRQSANRSVKSPIAYRVTETGKVLAEADQSTFRQTMSDALLQTSRS